MQTNTIRRRSAQRLLAVAAATGAVSMFGSSVKAGGPVYWDMNSTDAGAGGATPAGTWNDTNTNWGSADGLAAPVAWNDANGDTAVFAAGGDATGSYAITAGGNRTIAGFTMEEGVQVNVNQPTNWTFVEGSLAVHVQTGLLVINGQYFGSLITKTGPGILNSGANQNNSFGDNGKWVCTEGTLSFGGDPRIGKPPLAPVPDQITLSNGGKFRSGSGPTGQGQLLQFDVNRGITLGSGGGGFNTDLGTSDGLPNTTVWNGPITGASGGDLQMTGLGIVSLTNANNNWDGNTVISAGTLRVGMSNVIPDTSVVSQTAGTFDLVTNSTNETVKSISGTGGTIALSATSTLTLDSPAGETAAQTLNVPVGGKIIKNGAGALSLTGGAANNNASTGFRGEFVLNDGTLGIGTGTMLGGANTPTATLTINGGRLSNPDAADKNFNAALITSLSGDFQVGTNLFATPGVIRFNGGTQTIRNSNRTITVNGLANLQLAGVVAEDVPGRSLTKAGNGILQLSNIANTYSGGTIVNDGTLAVSRLHGLAADGTGLGNPVTINAGTIKVFESSPNLASGHPGGNNAFVSRPGSMITIANNGGDIVSLNPTTLTPRIYDGTLDLTNNDLVIDYDGASPIADVEDMIRAGRNGGAWNGKGIISSTAGSIAAAGAYTLGVIDNATVGITAFTTFSGQTVDPTTVLVKFVHRSDINMDGIVDFSDSVRFNGNYSEGTSTRWVFGDLNYNGVSDFGDSVLFNGGYDEALASLPEPGSALIFGIGALGLLARRRKSNLK